MTTSINARQKSWNNAPAISCGSGNVTELAEIGVASLESSRTSPFTFTFTRGAALQRFYTHCVHVIRHRSDLSI